MTIKEKVEIEKEKLEEILLLVEKLDSEISSLHRFLGEADKD